MQISITNTFKISVGEHEIILSMFDAEKLYQELGRALGKNSTNITLFRDSQFGTPETTPIPHFQIGTPETTPIPHFVRDQIQMTSPFKIVERKTNHETR